MTQPKLTAHDARRIAVCAAVDPRSVHGYFAGKVQRSTIVARVRDALETLGLTDPQRDCERQTDDHTGA